MDCGPPGFSVHTISQVRILKWVAVSSFRGSSQPREGTGVSCVAGGFFTIWATREAPKCAHTCYIIWRNHVRLTHFLELEGASDRDQPAPLSVGFSRQEYWSGLPLPPPGGLPDLGIKPASPVAPSLASGFLTTEPPEKPIKYIQTTEVQKNVF